jgi:hypothetical protein
MTEKRKRLGRFEAVAVAVLCGAVPGVLCGAVPGVLCGAGRLRGSFAQA